MLLKYYINFSLHTISNVKTQNYKIIVLIEGYNFHVKSIFI
jgi:hypothetical protein